MTSVAVESAAQLSFDTLMAAFNAGYEEYIIPLKLTPEQFRGHLENHDIDLESSRIAVAEDGIVGLALLGRRGEQGWVGGVGVAPAYRRQGIGRELMTALIKTARSTGVAILNLEVIVGNDGAYQLYQHLGFETQRRLCFLSRAPAPVTAVKSAVEEVSPDEALAHYERLHTTPNPWQRNRETLLKQPSALRGWRVVENDQVVAYAVTRAQTQSISWLDLAGESEEALVMLITAVHKRYPEAQAQAGNIGEDERAYRALQNAGYTEISLSQWEMRLLC